MKVLSLFSGIGAFEKALKNIGQPFELVGFSEIDKYAVKSYCAIHNVDESKNLGDITKIDENNLPKDLDLITYGFPCQDISLAGKQKGLFNEDGTQTRSGLFFEALRIIEATKPKVAIAENVKNLTGKKFNAQFQIVLASLEAAGYNNYYKVLNAKDFGVPQNRERVFIVSIRKDIDTGLFEFPKEFPLEKRLKDFLDDVVDEKYYLQQKGLEYVLKHEGVRTQLLNTSNDTTKCAITAEGNKNWTGNFIVEQPILIGGMQKNQSVKKDGVCTCLTAFMGTGGGYVPMVVEDPQLRQIGQMYPNSGNPQAGRIYDAEGISPTMKTCSGGNSMPKVLVREATKQGYAEAFEGDSINLEQPNSTTRRGSVGKQVAQTLTTSPQQAVVEPVAVWDGFNQRVRADSTVVGTLTQNCGADLKRNGQGIIESSLRIRKLTPKECFRLMGFSDEDFEKAAYYSVEEVENLNLRSSKKHKDLPLDKKIERVSNTQLYKQAGNSIVVDVIAHIFKCLN